jgi:magnesium-transporting ATPase (P-type)
MKEKIIYWDYAFWIMIFTILFFNIVVYIGQIVEKLVPDFNENNINNNKLNKIKILFEVYLQISVLVTLVYLMRESVGHYLRKIFNIQKNPDKFATLIVSPTVFMQLPKLKKKIKFVSNNVLNTI